MPLTPEMKMAHAADLPVMEAPGALPKISVFEMTHIILVAPSTASTSAVASRQVRPGDPIEIVTTMAVASLIGIGFAAEIVGVRESRVYRAKSSRDGARAFNKRIPDSKCPGYYGPLG